MNVGHLWHKIEPTCNSLIINESVVHTLSTIITIDNWLHVVYAPY